MDLALNFGEWITELTLNKIKPSFEKTDLSIDQSEVVHWEVRALSQCLITPGGMKTLSDEHIYERSFLHMHPFYKMKLLNNGTIIVEYNLIEDHLESIVKSVLQNCEILTETHVVPDIPSIIEKGTEPSNRLRSVFNESIRIIKDMTGGEESNNDFFKECVSVLKSLGISPKESKHRVRHILQENNITNIQDLVTEYFKK